MTEDFTKKWGSFNSEYCIYAGRERMHLTISDKLFIQSQKREEMKRMTEHITNLISEIALLNTEIIIKVNNIV